MKEDAKTKSKETDVKISEYPGLPDIMTLLKEVQSEPWSPRDLVSPRKKNNPVTGQKDKEKSTKAEPTKTKKAKGDTPAPVNEDPAADSLWNDFTMACDNIASQHLTTGKNGNATMVKITNDLAETLRRHKVNGHNVMVMINAMIRIFILKNKKHFARYECKHKSIL